MRTGTTTGGAHLRRWAGTTAVLVVVGALVAACSSASSPSSAPSTSPPVATLSYLHVVTPPAGAADATPYLANPSGSQVLLNGDAAVGMEDVAYPNANGGPALFPVDPSAYDGKCPAAQARIPQPPLCEVEADKPAYEQSTAPASGDDFAQMRALGFNAVRLVLNWSQLEPTSGHYSATYLDRVSQVVGWAGQQGIYVILDMHQDQYSRYILPGDPKTLPAGCTSSGGGDGAPGWAVFTDGKPACALFGESDLNPAESAAFYNFWHNHTVPGPAGEAPGTGLQDHYIGALSALAARFEHDPTVVGYEVMNEPQPGSLAATPVENLYQATAQDLFPFYQRVIEALTGVRDGLATCPASAPTSLTNTCAYPTRAHVADQQVFVEPMAYRNLIDFSAQASRPITQYKNLVWAPHLYTHAFTLDQFLGYPIATSPFPPSYTFGYQTAESEAQLMHAAVLTTEFGDSSSTDATVLAGETAAQESTLTGGTVWAWKGLSAVEGDCWCVRWQHSTYQTTANGQPGKGNPHATPSPDDQLIPSRQLELARVRPRATAGTLLAEQYDPTGQAFVLAATDPSAVEKGDRAAETSVYVPSTVHGPVAVTGAATLDATVTNPDGSKVVYVAPTGHGDYGVTAGTPSPTLEATVQSQSTAPLPPITEAQARAMTEAALTQAAQSPDSSIAGNAAVASSLAGLLLGTSDPTAG